MISFEEYKIAYDPSDAAIGEFVANNLEVLSDECIQEIVDAFRDDPDSIEIIRSDYADFKTIRSPRPWGEE